MQLILDPNQEAVRPTLGRVSCPTVPFCRRVTFIVVVVWVQSICKVYAATEPHPGQSWSANRLPAWLLDLAWVLFLQSLTERTGLWCHYLEDPSRRCRGGGAASFSLSRGSGLLRCTCHERCCSFCRSR
ncbi:hypothetical protein BDW42DRAFT_80108 [Aspergillus taichungensis]|uniref:Uncharacterized protein n=1 Tax=Aspergillus taichungensis TaxID=482145 RepID=A0A2J5HYH2_9EURO|nr:hypothetical protein BDW42DRAFT_80108 [Aspergillus taichungensis]